MLCGDVVCEPEQEAEQSVAADRTCHADHEGMLVVGMPSKDQNHSADDAKYKGDEQNEYVQNEERVIQDAVMAIARIAQLIIESKKGLKKVHHEKGGDEPS